MSFTNIAVMAIKSAGEKKSASADSSITHYIAFVSFPSQEALNNLKVMERERESERMTCAVVNSRRHEPWCSGGP